MPICFETMSVTRVKVGKSELTSVGEVLDVQGLASVMDFVKLYADFIVPLSLSLARAFCVEHLKTHIFFWRINLKHI